MTHDELLNKLLYKIEEEASYYTLTIAMKAVVESHKPVSKTYSSVFSSSHSDDGQQMVTRTYCEQCNYRYPCKTIQAIEKELK